MPRCECDHDETVINSMGIIIDHKDWSSRSEGGWEGVGKGESAETNCGV